MSCPHIPFRLDRNDGRSLTAQVEDGLRRAIDAGLYRPGDAVPGIRPLAAMLGVSEIITKIALRRLGEEGLLVPRRGVGNVVSERSATRWRGRVLYVTSGRSENYVYNVLGDILRARLFEIGYQFFPVPAWQSLDGAGLAQLMSALRQDYDLAVMATPPAEAVEQVCRHGIPTVEVCTEATFSGRGDWEVRFDDLALTDVFVRHCVRAGIRSVVSVFCGRSRRFASMSQALRQAGIAVSEWAVDPHDPERGVVGTVKRRACALFEKRLARGRDWLPDLLYFADDHVAESALMALMHHGVQIPDDVKVVAWENVGLGPVFHLPLTRFSFDAAAEGEKVASLVEDILVRGRARGGDRIVLAPRYVVGETFADACRTAPSPALSHQSKRVGKLCAR